MLIIQEKKAQAAMEFLMTYGWALLVVLIAIGALAFFGVLDPVKFLPQSCTLGAGFACNDFRASESSNDIKIILQNGLGDLLTSVTLRLLNVIPPCADAGTQLGALFNDGVATSISDGSAATFTLNCRVVNSLQGKKGMKLKGDLELNYKVGTNTNAITHKRIGQLVAGIEG